MFENPRRAIFACVCLLALIFVGCGHGTRRVQTDPSTITVLYGPEGDDEWILGPGNDETAQFLVFLPLVRINARGELEGQLAKSWEHSPDYRTWTIHLRADVRWHDGVPVTANDIKFTMDFLSRLDVAKQPPGAYSVTVVDDHTYTITYRKPAAGSPLDNWTVYYPKHLLEKLDPKKFDHWEFWKHPIGNGPYRYLRYASRTMMEFEANPDYFRGKPKIERVVLKFSEPSLSELLSGNVDVSYVRQKDLLKLAGDARFQTFTYIGADHIKAIVWNQRDPLFRDVRIRRALTLAINRRELHQTLNLPNQTPILDVIPTKRQFHRREFPEPLPYDPDQAKQLLNDAGWRDTDKDGIRDLKGKAFRFSALAAPLQDLDAATVYIQSQLRQIGIQVDVHSLDFHAAHRQVAAGKFEAAILIVHQSGKFGPLELFSFSGYKNPKVIGLLEKAQTSIDPDERDRIFQELMPILEMDMPMTILYPVVWSIVAHRKVRGLSSPFLTDPVWYMQDLSLED